MLKASSLLKVTVSKQFSIAKKEKPVIKDSSMPEVLAKISTSGYYRYETNSLKHVI